MLGVGNYLWRLVPANPILLRVVETAGKKRRDLFVRCGYLGLLILFVIFSWLTGQTQAGALGLADLSSASQVIFERLSYLQLALVALLAPIFTAGAISQERDSQTYDILLSTPLTNGQIVLGSLLSRLFFVLALLVSGIPVFSITQIFGGVAIQSIVLSFSIAAVTALLTGALAMAIATAKVGTGRTIFSFYLFIVLYLVGLFLLDKLAFFHIAGPTSASGASSHISWFTAIHPFLALRVVLGDPSYQAPDISQVPAHLRTWPISWYLTSPHTFFISFFSLLSVLLVMPSILFLRKIAQTTLSPKQWILTKFRIAAGDRSRKPRTVWQNPIAWREARTKGSASRAVLIRYGFMSLGLLAAIVLAVLYMMPGKKPTQFISRHGFSPSSNNLLIQGGQGSGTYGLTDDLKINLRTATGQDKEVSREYLRGEYEVIAFTTREVRVPGGVTNDIFSLVLAEIPGRLTSREVRQFLLGLVILEFAVILLVVTNTAASTVTREKEDGTLDLLLTTPITSRYYIWGKLWGLVSFVIPLIAVPVISCAIFVACDVARLFASPTPGFRWIVFPEAIVVLPVTLIIVSAFGAIAGMQMSLRMRTTVRAVMGSAGVVIGLCAMLGFCGNMVVSMRGELAGAGLAFAAFSPFTVLTLLIDPWQFGGRTFDTSATTADVTSARVIIFVFSLLSAAAYAAGVYAMYRSMVKNFDMTIRRQSR